VSEHKVKTATAGDLMRTVLTWVVVACAACVVSTPASGQRYDTAAGYGAGAISFGAFNQGAGGRELALESGWLAHVFGEGYTGTGHLGWRVSGGYTKRPLTYGDATRNISTFLADAGLLYRPVVLERGTTISPFATVGIGGISYALGQTGRPVLVEDANVFYPGNDQRQWMITLGAGVDVLPTGFRFGDAPLGIRVDVADHVTVRSPFERFDSGRSGPIHNIRLGISLAGYGWF
jgi:hypothetical protein